MSDTFYSDNHSFFVSQLSRLENVEVQPSTPEDNEVLPDVPVPVQYGIAGVILAILLKAFVSPSLLRLRQYIEEPEYDNLQVISLLNQLLVLSNGDRTAICMFHNGEKFNNGAHYWKATMTHEAVNAGVARISRDFKAVALSQLAGLLQKVRESDTLTFVEANARYDSIFSEYLADAGAEAVICNLIKDSEDKEVALLFIYYTKSTPSHEALDTITKSEVVSRILAQIKREITSVKKNNTAIVILSYALKILGF